MRNAERGTWNVERGTWNVELQLAVPRSTFSVQRFESGCQLRAHRRHGLARAADAEVDDELGGVAAGGGADGGDLIRDGGRAGGERPVDERPRAGAADEGPVGRGSATALDVVDHAAAAGGVGALPLELERPVAEEAGRIRKEIDRLLDTDYLRVYKEIPKK